jgi:hypothetical protein
MTWTAGADRATGDIITAAQWNTFLGSAGNITLTAPGVVTTQGDTVYATAANTLARLAKGSSRQSLSMNSGATAPEWTASPTSVLTATGDVLYASGASTLARLAKGSAREALGMNAAGTIPAYQSSIQSLMTTTGDVLIASGANTPARLAAAADGTVLTSTGAGSAPAWESLPASTATGQSIVEGIRDTSLLLALFTGAGFKAATNPETLMGFGLAFGSASGGEAADTAADIAGGGVLLKTNTMNTGAANVRSATAVSYSIQPNKNPYFFCQAIVGAGSSALFGKVFGFWDNSRSYTDTNIPKAVFRATTTGNIFFVTGNGSSEQTTDTSIAQDATTSRKLEVYTTDAGVTWIGKIDGSIVGTHSTQVPVVSTTVMMVQVGIVNNTTTNVEITNLQRIGAYQNV